jgi:hypothetical protein
VAANLAVPAQLPKLLVLLVSPNLVVRK